ncbi:GNAT family N-acetyltransferase [Silvimonas iriomotensis]|uniref:N-acetyltransferase domain-containing protein n=1 Tax=Silvimonas iriomotensis TaxID=449662 RepID=A0ABQ2PAR5_9NEIS|nr:GNAT family N-acetyltransferase [Silvimonas iriomotensis]GGP22059.1 hypothetical protein GCM10010970_23270 [Silvimonas iriomotensis]
MQSCIRICAGPATSPRLAALQHAWDAQLAPHAGERLEPLLYNAARGHGQQVVFAADGDRLIGCAAWVLLGVVQDGCAYGAPVIVLEPQAAPPLLEAVIAAVKHAGATRLRISARPQESAKQQALHAAGFTPVFDFVTFSLACSATIQAALPQDLTPVPFEALNWRKLYALYGESFRSTPNSPLPAFEVFMEDWRDLNREASQVLQSADGTYVAFCFIQDAVVESVGVDEVARGRGIANALYQHAVATLHAQGAASLSALVASSNTASMRLHQKTGFTESAPRRTVYELAL